MGGGSAPSPPSPPDPAQTARESISAQIEATPRILETQKEFGPQFTEFELGQLKEFGPQFTEEFIGLQDRFGPELARISRESVERLAPERIQAQRVLNDFLSQENLLSSSEEEQFKADLRGAQSVRGFAESGEASLDELRQLTALRQQLKAQRLGVAQSVAGLVPSTGAATVGQPQFGPGQLVQNVSPGDIFGLTSNNFAQQSANFRSQLDQSGGFSLGGSLGGGIGGALGGAALGSAIPVIGPAAGAIAGGAFGAGLGGFK